MLGGILNSPKSFATQQNELDEVLILAPKIKGSTALLVESRKKSNNVSEVLGSEQMARSGDSQVAASLRRVTGLTLMGGKFIYVRGLGERYSSVQMNQFNLPSPEPSRRVVPMDLFPSSTMESITVQKSFSPEYPAEFGGGLIQLYTKSLPEQFFFKASLSSNLESRNNSLSYYGGKWDWLGVDDGGRKMPNSILNHLKSGKKLIPLQPGITNGVPREELTQMGRSLPNHYQVSSDTSPQIPGLTLAIGNRFQLLGGSFGSSSSFLYGQDFTDGKKLSRTYNVGSQNRLELDSEKNTQYSLVENKLAGSVQLGFDWNHQHQISLNSFLLRHSSNLTQLDNKNEINSPSTTESTTLEWTERQLWTHQLQGKSEFEINKKPVGLQWRVGQSNASRKQPDRRDYSYDRTTDSYQIRGGSDGNRRTYSDLSDQSTELGLDLSFPVFLPALPIKSKWGLMVLQRQRKSDVFRLYFARDFDSSPSIRLADPPEMQFQAENIDSGKYQLQNITDAADSYSGKQDLTAQYFSLEYEPHKNWTLQWGARQEKSHQTVQTFYYYDQNHPLTRSDLVMKDLLPMYSLTWKPTDQWRARWVYSETLARPDFRELSEVGFIDDETGYLVEGDAHLKGTLIKNIDHRWEYYLTTDEYVSLAGFYKKFINPIEVMFKPGVNNIQTFANASSATNFGLEFESRIGLRRVSRSLRRWSLLGNLTLIKSQIELSPDNRGIQTTDSRPLQGQSPFVVNFQIQYDRPLWGLSATLLYNAVGPRITEVGTNQRPDTYEQTIHQVDFVASKKIYKTWNLGFKIANLLDPAIEAKQGDELVRSTHRKRYAALNMSAVF